MRDFEFELSVAESLLDGNHDDHTPADLVLPDTTTGLNPTNQC
ncbi:hypothetical protein AB0C77_15940 [Streptomyces sp. NPDC048629]